MSGGAAIAGATIAYYSKEKILSWEKLSFLFGTCHSKQSIKRNSVVIICWKSDVWRRTATNKYGLIISNFAQVWLTRLSSLSQQAASKHSTHADCSGVHAVEQYWCIFVELIVIFLHLNDICRQRKPNRNTGTGGDSLVDIDARKTTNFAVLTAEQQDRSVGRLSFALYRQIALYRVDFSRQGYLIVRI